MLNPHNKRESLIGKLLLSSALVAVTLTYGLWQRQSVTRSVVVAAIPKPASSSSNALDHAPNLQTQTVSPPAPSIAAQPQSDIASDVRARKKAAAPNPAIGKAAHEAPALNPPAQDMLLPPSPVVLSPAPALSPQASLAMYAPTDEASPPLSPVTGTPPPGTGPTVAAGTHLEDGDYLSDKHQFEWGDLKVKISIHGGQIVGVQILQYPDHRSQSLYLSQMAGPILESELIKIQQPQVDIVSSATDTSFAFQDSIANALTKATRG
jgi:uncharacterized protein with FMN-binding domain